MLARQIMTHPVISIEGSNSIRSAVAAMDRHGIRHLPVNEDGGLAGVFSKRDVDSVAAVISFFGLDHGAYEEYMDRPVRDLLKTKFLDRRELITVSPYDSITRVCTRMLENGLSAVPVMADEVGLVGMISYVDVLRAVDGGFVAIPTLR